jgi:hypothetical protein
MSRSRRDARRRRAPVPVLQAAGNAPVHRRSRQALHHADDVFRDRVDAVGFGGSMHAGSAAPDAVRVAGEEEPGIDADKPMHDTLARATLPALERVRVGDLLEKRPMPSRQIASTLRTQRHVRDGSAGNVIRMSYHVRQTSNILSLNTLWLRQEARSRTIVGPTLPRIPRPFSGPNT